MLGDHPLSSAPLSSFSQLVNSVGASSVGPIAGSGSGTVVANITGAGSAALLVLACAGVGVESFTSSGAAAVLPVAGAGTATESFIGTGNGGPAVVANSGSGSETMLGSGSAAMLALGGSGSGAEAFIGTGTASLYPLSLTGAGTTWQNVTGVGDASIAPISGSGDGGLFVSGSGSALLLTFAGSGSGSHAIVWPVPVRFATLAQVRLIATSSQIEPSRLVATVLQRRASTTTTQLRLRASMPHLRINHGDSIEWDSTIYDANGAAYPLTACTLTITVRTAKGAATAVAVVSHTEGGASSSTPPGGSITFTSAALGQIRCLIPAAASAALPNVDTTLVYELTVTDPAGNVFTPIDSTISMTMSV